MTLRGIVQNGVVVLQPGANVPDGVEVSVHVGPTIPTFSHAPAADTITDEERRRVLAILDRIASLPDENPSDTFSGADHDRALYGEP